MEFLNQDTKAHLVDLLPDENGDLGIAATWADEIKNRIKYGDQWLWASELHYVDVFSVPTKDCNYNDDRDCKDRRCYPELHDPSNVCSWKET